MTAHITAPTIAFHALGTAQLWNDAYAALTANINTHIDETDFPHPSLANASAALGSSPWGTLVKRSATDGGINVGPTTLTSHATGDNMLTIYTLTGQSGYAARGVENGVTQRWLIDAIGNFIGNSFQGQILGTTGAFTGALTFNTTKTAAATDGSNATGAWSGITIAASQVTGTLPSNLVANVTPAPTATPLQLATGAGYIYDTGGVPHQVAATSTTYAPPSTSTQANWALTYVNTATGALVTIYAAAGSSAIPSTVLPANGWAVAHAYFPINAAGVIVAQSAWGGGTQAFFIDARPENFASGSGGAATVLPSAIKDAATSASLADINYNTASGAYVGCFSVSNRTQVAITLAGGPIEIGSNGVHKVLPNVNYSALSPAAQAAALISQAGSTGTGGVGNAAGGAAGRWGIYADSGASSLAPGFNVTLGPPNVNIANCTLIGTVYFDGTDFWSESFTYTMQAILGSYAWRPQTIWMPPGAVTTASTVAGNTANTAPFAVMPGTVPVQVHVSQQMRGVVTIEAYVTQPATAVDVTIGLMYDAGSGYHQVGEQFVISSLDLVASKSRYINFDVNMDVGQLPPIGGNGGAVYNFQPYVIVSANQPVQFFAQRMHGYLHL